MESLSSVGSKNYQLHYRWLYWDATIARVIFGNMVDSDIAMDLPEGTTAQNPEDYLVKLREAQSILVQTTQEYLKKNQRKRGVDGGRKDEEITKFAVGDYVLLTVPNRPQTSYQECIVVQWLSR